MSTKEIKEAQIAFNEGVFAFNSKCFAKGVEYFEEASRILNNSESYLFLGKCYSNLEEYQKALSAYETSYRRQGSKRNIDFNLNILNHMADTEQVLGNFDNAKEYYDECLAIISKINAKYKYEEIRIEIEKKRKTLNHTDGTQTMKYWNAFFQGKNLEKEKAYGPAIELYSKSLCFVETPEAYYKRGRCYKELKNFNEAIVDYKKCILLKGETLNDNLDVNALFHQSVCYMKIRDYKSAKDLFYKALENLSQDNEAKKTIKENYGKATELVNVSKP